MANFNLSSWSSWSYWTLLSLLALHATSCTMITILAGQLFWFLAIKDHKGIDDMAFLQHKESMGTDGMWIALVGAFYLFLDIFTGVVLVYFSTKNSPHWASHFLIFSLILNFIASIFYPILLSFFGFEWIQFGLGLSFVFALLFIQLSYSNFHYPMILDRFARNDQLLDRFRFSLITILVQICGFSIYFGISEIHQLVASWSELKIGGLVVDVTIQTDERALLFMNNFLYPVVRFPKQANILKMILLMLILIFAEFFAILGLLKKKSILVFTSAYLLAFYSFCIAWFYFESTEAKVAILAVGMSTSVFSVIISSLLSASNPRTRLLEEMDMVDY